MTSALSAFIRRLASSPSIPGKWTSMRTRFGRRRVITELKTRGVHGSVIDKAVDAAYDGVSDEKQAREYLRKKRMAKPKDRKEAARIFRQLMRAGFASKTIFAILKKWDVEDEVLSALEEENSE